jgi:hypothetical protein
MAKRARGSTRPGQRRPIQRVAGRPVPAAPIVSATPRPASLTPEEEARAAELEAAIVAEERAAEDMRRRTTERRRGSSAAPSEVATGSRTSTSLAVRAAEEYAYVGRDVRRITLIGGALIVILVALFILTHLTGTAAI